MNNSFIPAIFKEKILYIAQWIYGMVFLLLSLSLFLALLTFDISDNSFLTSSSEITKNLLGVIGSYVASFLIYSFGLLSYSIVFFLLMNSFFAFKRKRLNFFFIRLLLFLIGIILIPHSFYNLQWEYGYIDQINFLGEISYKIYLQHQIQWLSYTFTFIGFLIILFTLNINKLFKLPRFDFKFKSETSKNKQKENLIKKEPVIKTDPLFRPANNEIEQENYNETINSKKISKVYKSPSLDILDNEANIEQKKKNQSNTQERAKLLEKVFAEFKIEISVINIKLGPVVTLYEILPSAGIKVNTIINLAGDI